VRWLSLAGHGDGRGVGYFGEDIFGGGDIFGGRLEKIMEEWRIW